MGNMKHSTSRKPTPTAPDAGESTDLGFAVDAVPPRFDVNQLAKHDFLLGRAGDFLNHAYEASKALATMGSIVRSSQISRTNGGDALTLADEDNLMSGIVVLASMLSNELCSAADMFERRAKTSNGSVQ